LHIMRNWEYGISGLLFGVLLGGAISLVFNTQPTEDPVVQNHEPLAEPKQTITLAAGGDVIFGRYRGNRYITVGGDNPFEHLTESFNSADISFFNLETPLSERDPGRQYIARKRGILFRGAPSKAKLIAESGVDVVSRGNNHAEDCWAWGLNETTEHLNDFGIEQVGVSKNGMDPFSPLQIQRDQTKVIFFSFTMRRNLGLPKEGEKLLVAFSYDPDVLDEIPPRIEAIRKANPNALILVSAHWGEEYRLEPNSLQRNLAHAIVDAGANAILGHHPHVLQPVERYNNGIILYSMGNLIFDQTALAQRETGVFSITFQYEETWRISEFGIQPLMLTGAKAGPREATEEEADQILEPLIALSEQYNTRLVRTESGAAMETEIVD